MNPTSTLTVLGADSSPILGSNIVSNGTFDTDLSGWTATGWNWSSGKAQHTAGNTNMISQSVFVEADEFYLLQFTLSNVIDWQSWIYMYVGGDREYCISDFCGHSFRATSTGLVDISITTMSSAGVSMIDDVVFQKITNPSLPVMRILENNGNEGIEIRSGEAASKNMFIGFQAGGNTKHIANYSGGYNTGIGYQSLYTNITGGSNTAMGAKALFSNINGGTNVAIGDYALFYNTSGNSNIAIGSSALYSNTIGLENIAIGDLALYENTEGYTNIAIGREALQENTTGSNNLALGYAAAIENLTGSHNTSIGYQTNYYNTAGNENVAVGYDALLYAEEGSWNTAIGTFALENTLPAAFANTALGYGAGRGNATGYSNSSSTWVGYQSGYNIRTGSKNITLGYKTADSLTTGSGNIVIGYDIDTPAANSDNTLTIGNIIFANGLGNTGTTVATGTVGVGIAAPTAKFHISRSTGGIEKLFQVGTTTTTDIFSVNSNGRVGVGTSTPWEAMEFAVAGDIVVTGNVYKSATAYVNPDYVFAKYFNNPYNEIIPDDYQMLSLDDLGLYIQEHNHLPGVEMKSGVVDIFEANRLNLEKIEELSLYILEINNRIKVFEEQGGEEEIEMAQDYQYSKLTVRDKAIFEGDIIVEDHIYFNKDAVGQAKILVGATEVEIRFDKGYEYSPIVTATPNEFIEGQYKITEKTNDGFKIVLEKKQFLDIVFDWHAFASPEAKLFVSDGSVEEIQLSVSNEQLIIEASQEQVSEASSEQPATELEAVEGSITQEITAEEPAAEPPPADGQVAGEATEAGPDEEITSTEGDDHPAIEAEMLNESFDESTEIEAVPTE